MKKRLLLIAVLGCLSMAATSLTAQNRIGPHLGINFEGDAVFIGGNGWFPFSTLGSNPLLFAPRLDFYLDEGYTRVDFVGDLVVEFSGRNVRPYAGAGLDIMYVSADGGGSDTDFGLDLLGGVQFVTGGVTPFVGLVLTVGGGSEFKLVGGLAFGI